MYFYEMSAARYTLGKALPMPTTHGSYKMYSCPYLNLFARRKAWTLLFAIQRKFAFMPYGTGCPTEKKKENRKSTNEKTPQ
jgi:hypothetical protein